MKISIVINTYNRLYSLPTTLRSLELLRYPEIEVIVVDGPSTDGTLTYLNTYWSDKIKICTCPEANLSKSRNVGISHASGEIICFTDDDGVPEPDWLDNLVNAYEDPEVAAAGGWVRNHTGVEFQTKYIVSSRDSTSQTDVDEIDSVPASKPLAQRFPGLIGVNSSFRRTTLIEIGGFDEEYAYFLDETDVITRLVDGGYKVAIVPEAEVHHKYAPSHIRSPGGTARSWLQIMTSTAYYIIKNATPNTRLSTCMESIEWHKQNLTKHTNWYLSQGTISEETHSELISEIEQGAHQGISDAFQFTFRQLMQATQGSEWHGFERPLAPNKRLRIAFVTALYPPRPCGGVAVFIYNLATRLADFGHEITVITQAENGRVHTVDFENGVWVHRLPGEGDLASEYPETMPDMPSNLKKASAQVLAELDRVDEHRHFQYVIGTIWDMDLAAVMASGKYPTAMYLVTSYQLMEDSKPEWRQNRSFYEGHFKKMVAAEAWGLRQADQILASTTAIKNDIESAYGLTIDKKKLTILPFGVPEPTAIIGNKSTTTPGVSLLFVGRFEKRKGADILLEVLPELLQRFSELQVTCIGDNSIPSSTGKPYTIQFQEKYGQADWIDRIHFLGHVDDSTLEQAYANCDIFVAPSLYESFGLIYLEAMRYGKPCIGTKVGGIPEIVVDGETGILIPPGDAPSLKNAISNLVEDEHLRSTLGESGRRIYQERFTTERFAREFETLIHAWIDQDSRSRALTISAG